MSVPAVKCEIIRKAGTLVEVVTLNMSEQKLLIVHKTWSCHILNEYEVHSLLAQIPNTVAASLPVLQLVVNC